MGPKVTLNQTTSSLVALAAFAIGAFSCGSPLRYPDQGAEPWAQVDSIDLTPLLRLEEYAKLDREAAELVAFAARQRWSEEFEGFEFQRVSRFASGGQAFWISIWLHPLSGLDFMLIPGGQFMMGSPEFESQRAEDEGQHAVILDPFLIARTECTQDAYESVARTAAMEPTPSIYRGSGDLPVENVSVEDADLWCREAGLILPTEAQWEYACRSGTRKSFYRGSTLTLMQARIAIGEDEEAPTLAVGGFWPNAFGLHDVHGNVFEWCRDSYLSYDQRVTVGTGQRIGESAYRVRRGGSYTSDAAHVRSASRDQEDYSRTGEGFRPAKDLPR